MKQAPPYIILRRTSSSLMKINGSKLDGLLASYIGSTGVYNGYVSLPLDHPWYGKDYDDLPDVDVHGGLTYANMENDRWVIGFDTCHLYDTAQYWTVEAVAAEAESLLKQAEAVYKF